MALVVAGQISTSWVSRVSHVADHLGPVKGNSFRLASRSVNSLRAGFPVSRYEDLEPARLILISVPPKLTPVVVQGLAASKLRWQGKAVVLCDPLLESRDLAPLCELGASTASLCPVEGFEDQFVAEGDQSSVRLLRRLLFPNGQRLFDLPPSTKPLFLAGLAFSSALLSPLLASSAECFRAAGLSSFHYSALIERGVERALRGYLKAGRKSLVSLPLMPPAVLVRRLQALKKTSPGVADLFHANVVAGASVLRPRNERAAAATVSTRP